ncbi:MAG TPA: glutamate 5-kinase, partial [Paracoccaceae bacterium]|nr:glutamate 5-kinase [Paracoccaceae bacterium]
MARARRLVVKIGSALLVGSAGLRGDWLAGLAADVAAARKRGTDVVIVSSGSIALGRKVLGLPAGALPLEQAQAAAAVGQIRLARAYEEALSPHGIVTGQVLVTLEDTEDRRRYLNSRATMQTLLSLGVVPIVNENDTVATDEIRFGDNDRLAALVSHLTRADALVLLSDVDALYDAPPTSPGARRIDRVDGPADLADVRIGGSGSDVGTGGMVTKLDAAAI